MPIAVGAGARRPAARRATRSRSPSSATAPSARARSTRPEPGRASGTCRSSSSARTTATRRRPPIRDTPAVRAPRRPRRRLRDAGRDRRRQRRRWPCTTRCRAPVARARARRGADAGRVHDLPPRRPPRAATRRLPPARGARSGWRARDPIDRARGAADRGGASTRRPMHAIDAARRRRIEDGRRVRDATAPSPSVGGRYLAEVCRRSSAWSARMNATATALREALREEMERDPSRVRASARTSASGGGSFRVTQGLLESSARAGLDTPISEAASSAPRSARRCRACGRSSRSCSSTSSTWPWTRSSTRPPRCATCPAARSKVPMVIRTQGGAGARSGAQHSQSLEALVHARPRPEGRDARPRRTTPRAC